MSPAGMGRLVVEAFMYRSHPLIHAVKKAVDEGAIGELRMIRSSFCYRTTKACGQCAVRCGPGRWWVDGCRLLLHQFLTAFCRLRAGARARQRTFSCERCG